MRVLLIDADSQKGFPNLALMKISAVRKEQGHQVSLILGIPDSPPLMEYDMAYGSCLFYQNRARLENYLGSLNCHYEVGGTGISPYSTLPPEVEHHYPDYSLYDTDFSLGFTSRGCIRKCPWCVVPQKEGDIKDNASLDEFVDPARSKLILLDNNFLASPKVFQNLHEIQQRGLKVNFNQGLDIRLVDRMVARELKDTKTYDWHFKSRMLHFAFDSIGVEQSVRQGVSLLVQEGFRARDLMFYVLVGFNTAIEQDLYRVEVLKELGVIPYIMRYNQTNSIDLDKLAAWVNLRHYRIPFDAYQRHFPHSKKA